MPLFFLRLNRLFLLFVILTFSFMAGVGVNLLFVLDASGQRRVKAFLTMICARRISRILGIHIRREGNYSNIPCRFTVSNHISYIDILVLASMFPSVFISKHEVKRWPFIGWLTQLAGTIFVDRTSQRSAWNALSDIEKTISSNVNVIVFPEGTTTDGSGLMTFKTLFFQVPVTAGVPITPVSLSYLPSGDEKDRRSPSPAAWYGDMAFVPHLWKILGMKSIQAIVYFNPVITEIITASGTSHARKLLSLCTHEYIRDGLSKKDSYVLQE